MQFFRRARLRTLTFLAFGVVICLFLATSSIQIYLNYSNRLRTLEIRNAYLQIGEETIRDAEGLADTHLDVLLNAVDSQKANYGLSTLIIIIAASTLTILGVGSAFFLSFILTTRLKKITGLAANIQKGDFSQKVEVLSLDEIGVLGSAFNSIIDTIKDILGGIKGISVRAIKIKDELSTGSNETVESLVGVTSTTENIGAKVATLDDHIANSTTAIEEIAKTISSLRNQIEIQTNAITQSTASVEQMIASLNNVSNTIQNKKQSTNRLSKTAIAGGEKVDATNRIIQQILEDADSIMNMVGIINSIAAQTNVLAINAAIEGAHAGVNGKGFSVIAEEIKNLAESTNVNAKSISAVLESTVAKMQDASTAGVEMRDAFQNIETDVTEVADAFEEIVLSTTELSAGGNDIINATTNLTEVQDRIREGSLEMTSGAEEISHAIYEVRNISAEVTSSMSEIETTVADITQVIVNVADASDQLRYAVEALNAEVGRLKTDES